MPLMPTRYPDQSSTMKTSAAHASAATATRVAVSGIPYRHRPSAAHAQERRASLAVEADEALTRRCWTSGAWTGLLVVADSGRSSGQGRCGELVAVSVQGEARE